jgi:sarcosine oxidase subunit beta
MNAKVIVIGGGVIGTACAYFLARRGAEVLILERSHLASGASGATAAIISISGGSGTPQPLRPLSEQSYHLILDIKEDFDVPLELIDGGSLHVAVNEQETREIQQRCEDDRGMGIDGKLLDGEEARRLEPLLSPQIAAAYYNPAGFHVNPFRLCEGYLNAASRRGCRTAYGVGVREIKIQNGRIDRVVTDQGDYHADWVVVAGGAFTPEIISSLGIKIPIVPARGQVIITEACEQRIGYLLYFFDHLYIKQTAKGNFYLGSHTEYVGFENRITLEKISAYVRTLSRSVPLLARLRGLRFFTGFRPLSDDGLPVIGPLPDCSRLMVASGHGRTGVRFSAITGKIISELIMDGKTESSVEALGVDRFCDSP